MVSRLASNVRLRDRKSTRLNSSHTVISYAVFCLLRTPPTPTLFPYTTLFRSVLRLRQKMCHERITGPDFGLHRELAAAFHRIHGIKEKIQKDLLHLI